DVDVAVGGDLAEDQGGAGGQRRLAGDASERVLGEDGVEDGVGDLVGDLVGMTLGDRLRGEEVARQGAHGRYLPSPPAATLAPCAPRPAPVQGCNDASRHPRQGVLSFLFQTLWRPLRAGMEDLGACRSTKPFAAANAAWISSGPPVSRSSSPLAAWSTPPRGAPRAAPPARPRA